MTEARDCVIRASEIGQYTFCAQAWWLGSVEGRPSTNRQELAAGETAHLRHGLGVQASLLLSRLAYAALVLAMVVGLIWLVSRLVG
jgi:hypothetical protein